MPPSLQKNRDLLYKADLFYKSMDARLAAGVPSAGDLQYLADRNIRYDVGASARSNVSGACVRAYALQPSCR